MLVFVETIQDSAWEQKNLPPSGCPTLPLFLPEDSKVHPTQKSRNDQTSPANFILGGGLLLEAQAGSAEATSHEVQAQTLSQQKAERTRNMLRGNIHFSSA